jgi:hypothetical protein
MKAGFLCLCLSLPLICFSNATPVIGQAQTSEIPTYPPA